MVWPSPLLRTTSMVPMVPPPPERFSTTADWPQAVCRCAASNRPITSVVPPAAAGTIRRTVSVGRQSPAPRLARGRMAAVESAAAPVNTRRRENVLVVTSHSLWGCCFAATLGSTGRPGKRATWRRRARNQRRRHRFRDAENESVEAKQLEQRRQVAEFLAGRGRGAADEVEDPAVLQTGIGEPLHLAFLVQIDHDHPLGEALTYRAAHPIAICAGRSGSHAEPMMLWPFNHFRKPRIAPRGTIETIYGMIVTQAREPLFYRDLGVPDTVNGRFDLLLLHLWLLVRRAKAPGKGAGGGACHAPVVPIFR